MAKTLFNKRRDVYSNREAIFNLAAVKILFRNKMRGKKETNERIISFSLRKEKFLWKEIFCFHLEMNI